MGARPPKAAPPSGPPAPPLTWEGPRWHLSPRPTARRRSAASRPSTSTGEAGTTSPSSAIVCPTAASYEGRGPGVALRRQRHRPRQRQRRRRPLPLRRRRPFTPESRTGHGRRHALARPGGKRHAHRDWKPTACPGDTITAWAHSPAALTPGPTRRHHHHGRRHQAYLDAKFLAVAVELDAIRDDVAGAPRRREAHNAADRSRDPDQPP